MICTISYFNDISFVGNLISFLKRFNFFEKKMLIIFRKRGLGLCLSLVLNNELILFATKTFATEIIEDIITLEHQRDLYIMEHNYPRIEESTHNISEYLTHVNIDSSTNFSSCIESIIKTRHLFSGKADVLTDFYKINSLFYNYELIPSLVKFFSLIIISDTIADLSINDDDFSIDMKQMSIEKHNLSFKNKITDKLHGDLLNKEVIEYIGIEINKILCNDLKLQEICEIEQRFAPILNFNIFYNELMATPVYRNYEVIGVNKYTYWPALLNISERNVVQKFLSKNEYYGRFSPLSMLFMQINCEATKHFPMLDGHTGSFIPYSFRFFSELDPIDILLISECKSSVVYDTNTLIKIKTCPSTISIINHPFLQTKEEILYATVQGIAKSSFTYACMLYKEIHESQHTFALCLSYIKRSSNRGYVKAQYTLGVMNYNGIYIKKDINEAARLYNLAANQGHVKAQYYLGIMYKMGVGVTKNPTEAVKLFQLAVNRGNAEAQYELGKMYQMKGFLKNDIEAARLLSLAAAQNHVEAQYSLGLITYNGIGIDRNLEKASYLYQLAADQGHIEAQYNLGIMYRIGAGVTKSEEKAEKFYRLAADQGHTEAQYKLSATHREIIVDIKDEKNNKKLCRRHQES